MFGEVDRRKLAEAAEGESLINHSGEPPVREVSSDQLPDSLLKGHAPKRKKLFIHWVTRADQFEDHVIHISLEGAAEHIGCGFGTARKALEWFEKHGLITAVSRIHSLYKVRWSFKRTKEENIHLCQVTGNSIESVKTTPLIRSQSEGILWNRLTRIYPFVFKEVPAAGFIDFQSIKNFLDDHEQLRFFTLRYDFVCCDRHSLPVDVWEYNGAGHFDDFGNPKPEDLIKRRLKRKYCECAGIGYFEINGAERLEITIELLEDILNETE